MRTALKKRLGGFVSTSITGETVRAYVPAPLPPSPPLDVARLLPLITRAEQALGRLDGMTSVLPSSDLFVYMYVRKEALLSSQIEGTQSSISDLLLFENNELQTGALDDVQDVSNYVAAMRHGLARIEGGFPLSLRLIREMHGKLLAKGRGDGKQPGEFRRSQNWIGGTRPGNAIFVPPPPHLVDDCLANLEAFIHDRDVYPVLLRAAIAHVQFETIHPFLDGNGRLGRLLVTLMLCEQRALREPVLYLSLYLKRHRAHYYDLLQTVRRTGDWEAWIEFFLEGVTQTAEQSVETARRLLKLFVDDEAKIGALGRATASALRVHAELKRSPLLSAPVASKLLKISQPTVQKSVDHLIKLGIVEETTGQKRGRVYRYTAYLKILDEGTEPLIP